jgi:uncharacterized membrane protein YtjA (UPF0391 family)
MILSLWSLGYLALVIVAAIFAFVVLEGDAASKASGWFYVSVLVFLLSVPMSRKK